MNISLIKEELERNIGKEVVIRYNLGRNKIEKYHARIKELYNYIFIVEIEKNSELKSFTYSDVITSTIKIDYK